MRDELKGLPKTVHGGQAWRLSGVEDYSHNLNPFGPVEEMQGLIDSAIDGIGHYPDDSSAEFRSVVAKEHGIKDENVIAGSGSSDIIRLFPNTFLNKGDKVVINRPSFAEYSQQCKIAGAIVQYNQLYEDDDFLMNRDVITTHIASGAKAIYICNPNNPTGRIEPRDKILSIVKEAKDRGVMVFLDETLLELCYRYGDVTCSKYVNDYDNLVVIGSLTKSFAIPGIRIGFGFAAESLIDEMNKVRLPWNVGQIEQAVGTALIRDHMDYVRVAAKVMHEESIVMHAELGDIGFPVTKESDSFFYFNSLKDLNVKGADFQKAMLKRNVMVRDCASFGEPFDWFVRFSVKDRERNRVFVSAVEESLKELR